MIKISDADLHPHLKARMNQRGITLEEIQRVLEEVFIFPYNQQWEGNFFDEKEVSVYYRLVNDTVVLLTVKARYGKGFSKEGEEDEVRI